MLGFPVPQLVLAENPRRCGTFIVIDGKQRLLTIASLYLKAYRNYWTQPRFSGLSVLKDLNHISLDAFLTESQYSKDRRQLGNADIRTTVITGFQGEDVLYDIFYRINTGSVPLSSQELRQVLNRGEFAKYLLEITGEQNPLWEVLGIDVPDPRLRDVELLLRLIAWRRFSKKYRGNNSALKLFGSEVGRKLKGGRYERALNRALFEVQAYYLSFPKVRSAAAKKKVAIVQASKQLFADNDFTASIESTTKSLENYRIRFGRYQRMLENALGVDVPTLEIPPAR